MHWCPRWLRTTQAQSTWNLAHVHKMTINTACTPVCVHTHWSARGSKQAPLFVYLVFFFLSLSVSISTLTLPSPEKKQAGKQAARLDSRPIRLVSSNRISWERERDDKPVCCRALSSLKHITHSKWSCWSQTAVDLITPKALCGCGTF